MSCEGHCVCAPQDQKCPLSENLSYCVDTSIGNYHLVFKTPAEKEKKQTNKVAGGRGINILLILWFQFYDLKDCGLFSSLNVCRPRHQH